MRLSPILLISPLLLALPACADMAASDGGGMAMADGADMAAADAAAMPTDAMGYLAMAGSSDLYEIESSRIQNAKGSSSDIKRFAQMMIDHHSKTTQQAMAAAKAAGMNPPPPALMPPQRDMVAQLQPLSGAELDSSYVSQQKTAHQMALALHRNYAERGDTPALQQVARTTVPIVEQHLAQLQSLGS